MRIAKEGLIFILPASGLCLLSALWRLWFLSMLSLFLSFCFTFFFRNPKRTIPANENFFLSPADGKVIKIETLPSLHPNSRSITSVHIFLSLFDVHFTRAPLTATVEKITERKGKFFPAYKKEASFENQSKTLYFQGKEFPFIVKHTVGIAARRIRCYVKENQKVERGERIALMYFGSRVEVSFPSALELRVSPHQKVKAGETVLAEVMK